MFPKQCPVTMDANTELMLNPIIIDVSDKNRQLHLNSVTTATSVNSQIAQLLASLVVGSMSTQVLDSLVQCANSIV